MSDLRHHDVELSTGRTVTVTFRRLPAADGPLAERHGSLTLCHACPGDRVHLTACGFARQGRVDCERRCPDCGHCDAGAWPEASFVEYETRLRHALDDLARIVERREAKRVETLVNAFAQALADDLLLPDDFAP